jgi:hypothetical protein
VWYGGREAELAVLAGLLATDLDPVFTDNYASTADTARVEWLEEREETEEAA